MWGTSVNLKVDRAVDREVLCRGGITACLGVDMQQEIRENKKDKME